MASKKVIHKCPVKIVPVSSDHFDFHVLHHAGWVEVISGPKGIAAQQITSNIEASEPIGGGKVTLLFATGPNLWKAEGMDIDNPSYPVVQQLHVTPIDTPDGVVEFFVTLPNGCIQKMTGPQNTLAIQLVGKVEAYLVGDQVKIVLSDSTDFV